MEQIEISPKIIDKLQKLLALAGSDNEHEAALAMSKAEALMREHNFSVADVAINGSGVDVQFDEVYGTAMTYQIWVGSLAASISGAFNGKVISGQSNGRWKLTFIAGRTDLAIIIDLFARLQETIKRMSRQYVKREANFHPGIRREMLHKSYRLGMIQTIHARLMQLKKNTTPDDVSKNAYGLTGKELMTVKDKAVEQMVSKMFPNLRRRRASTYTIHTMAYQQGKADGHTVSLHRSVNDNGIPAAIAR
jgi:Protein of unknown function (DUF2786)